MFASPAAGQVYRVAKAANAGGGVLLSYGNYAGDVLHFGQAQLRLNAEGIETRTVLVTDDIASAPLEQIEKRRGIAGDLTVFKIAGAAAEAGLSLDDVERLAIRTNYRTRSLGVAFDGCTLPGAEAPLFSVPAGHMSLGLGIHGEPGISDHPMPTASELAELLVSRLLADKPDDAGTRVVAIVNGLGTVKYDELFLLFGKIEKLLTAAGLTVVEPECGELVTSLDMSGLSLTLLWLDEELEQYWAAPADTPAFRKGNLAPRARRELAGPDARQRAPTSNGHRRGGGTSAGWPPPCSARCGTSSSSMKRNWATWTPSPATATTASACAAAWTPRQPREGRRRRPAPRLNASSPRPGKRGASAPAEPPERCGDPP